MSPKASVFLLAALAAALPSVLPAQTDADLLSRLKDKPLYLRGFWDDDKLEFSADGKPASAYQIGPFTTAGMDVESVNLSGGVLEIRGTRAGIEFIDSGTAKRVPLLRPSGWHRKPETIDIRIDGIGDANLSSALDAVFGQGIVPPPDELPRSWQAFVEAYASGQTGDARGNLKPKPCDEAAVNLRHEALRMGSASAAAAGCEAIYPGRQSPMKDEPKQQGVTNPQVISMKDPEFSRAARSLRYSGSVEVYFIVDKDGMPEDLQIIKAAGLGLDEQALAAVAQYRFKPAEKNGQPIVADIYVDLNFQIF